MSDLCHKRLGRLPNPSRSAACPPPAIVPPRPTLPFLSLRFSLLLPLYPLVFRAKERPTDGSLLVFARPIFTLKFQVLLDGKFKDL
ncbi:hypothetical protein BD309DRAFT_505729 [Dichomitus squalens]|nr:hypothetical protein BD309DRAFT_505729 [Dichomitus squalens]